MEAGTRHRNRCRNQGSIQFDVVPFFKNRFAPDRSRLAARIFRGNIGVACKVIMLTNKPRLVT